MGVLRFKQGDRVWYNDNGIRRVATVLLTYNNMAVLKPEGRSRSTGEPLGVHSLPFHFLMV
jgi:hypothetical protein